MLDGNYLQANMFQEPLIFNLSTLQAEAGGLNSEFRDSRVYSLKKRGLEAG